MTSPARRAVFGTGSRADRVLVLDRTSLNVSEGMTASFGVRLGVEPLGDVVVTATSNDTNEATVAPETRTFTRAGSTIWSDFQNFVVSGVHDTDPIDENTTIELSSSGGGYNDTASLAVAVFDDDVRGLTLSANALTFPAGVTMRTVNVRLDTLPTGNVTITASSSDTDVVTVSPNTRTYTTTNWNTNQTFTISAPTTRAGGSATISFNPSGADYGAVATRTVQATVSNTQELDVTPTALTVNEGATATIRVRLPSQPSGTVTVSATSSDTGAATVTPSSRTFTRAGASIWSTFQNFTIAAQPDNDANNETVNIDFTSSGGGFTDTERVVVTVRDTSTRSVRVSDDPLVFGSSESTRQVSQTVLLTDVGTGTWTVPTGANSVDVQLVGAGGGGGSLDGNARRSGGGGGGGTTFGTLTAGGGGGGNNGVGVSGSTRGTGGTGGGGAGGAAGTGHGGSGGGSGGAAPPGRGGAGGVYSNSAGHGATGATANGSDGDGGSQIAVRAPGGASGSAGISGLTAYGRGGDSAVTSSAPRAGGGGGGGYTQSTITTTPGNSINYLVGGGGGGSTTLTLNGSGLAGQNGAIRLVYTETVTSTTLETRKTLGVRLNTQPTGTVTVAVSVIAGTDGSTVNVTPTSLTFNASNFQTFKFITVTTNVGETDDPTISLNPSGADYNSVATRNVAVNFNY